MYLRYVVVFLFLCFVGVNAAYSESKRSYACLEGYTAHEMVDIFLESAFLNAPADSAVFLKKNKIWRYDTPSYPSLTLLKELSMLDQVLLSTSGKDVNRTVISLSRVLPGLTFSNTLHYKYFIEPIEHAHKLSLSDRYKNMTFLGVKDTESAVDVGASCAVNVESDITQGRSREIVSALGLANVKDGKLLDPLSVAACSVKSILHYFGFKNINNIESERLVSLYKGKVFQVSKLPQWLIWLAYSERIDDFNQKNKQQIEHILAQYLVEECGK